MAFEVARESLGEVFNAPKSAALRELMTEPKLSRDVDKRHISQLSSIIIFIVTFLTLDKFFIKLLL